ncbi:hypothetical protein J4437_04770 [Candidatus Woesearchaeota archaeon]|nr:hypothetical protein [Candidatus Woesearchaeota archaeon]
MPTKNEIPAVRPAAICLTFKEIIDSELRLPEDEPPFLIYADGKRAYRINTLGTIVNKEKIGNITNFLLDDGSATLVARFFEESKNIEALNPGDIVLIIGKVRLFNEEKYLSPEIVKKVSPLWMKLRRLGYSKSNEAATKIKNNSKLNVEIKTEQQPANFAVNILNTGTTKKNKIETKLENKIKIKLEEERVAEEVVEEEEIVEDLMTSKDNTEFPFQKIGNIIKDMDSGSGVLIEDILEKSPLKDTETLIKKMLEKGDIYQITPGKVKLL